MAVVINEFEAVVDNGAEAGGSKKAPKSPVTSAAKTMRLLTRIAGRQNRLRAT